MVRRLETVQVQTDPQIKLRVITIRGAMTKTLLLFALALALGLYFGVVVGKKVRLQRLKETISRSDTKFLGWCDNLAFRIVILAIGIWCFIYAWHVHSLSQSVLGAFVVSWGCAYWWKRTHSGYWR